MAFDFKLTFFCGIFLTGTGFPSLPPTPDLVDFCSEVYLFAGDLDTLISNLLGVAISVFWNLDDFLAKGLESNKLLTGFTGDAFLATMDSLRFFF